MTINATNITMRIGAGGVLQHPSPPIEVAIGTDWLFFGDSQTGGTAVTGTSVDHPHEAFENIWNQTFSASITRAFDGVGGDTIDETNVRYSATSGRSTATLVGFQESGGQYAVQDTAAKFAALFTSFVEDIDTDSPNAVILYETAYSFEAEAMTNPNRDWSTYNTAMLAEVATLAGQGVTVYVAETDRNITELVAQKTTALGDPEGHEEVWGGPSDVLGRHYTELGNFMVALSYFEALGYAVDDLDLSDIPVGDVSAADKALCISIIEGF